MQGNSRSKLTAALAALAAGALASAPGAYAQEPTLEAVEVEGFDQPTYAEAAPGFPDLLFVTDKSGVVHVLEDEQPLDEPFLDVTDIVEGSPFDEQGLLSIAFPPDYASSRRFYLYFTNDDGDIEVDEFKRKRSTPTEARPSSRRRVIVVPHPVNANHNGGTVRVDATGKLWLATGDGGGGGDGDDNARDTESLLGKLLRVWPVPHNPDKPGYRIPKRNPYVDGPGRDEIFSYGLRNPYRFEIDDELGAVLIGDVGQGSWEEVDLVARQVARGGNFGWPQYEGDAIYDANRPGADPPIAPSFTYPNTAQNPAAVTGGLVVDDPGLPSLAGRYLFADFYGAPLATVVPTFPSGPATDGRSESLTVSQPVAFTDGVAGQVYVTSMAGTVYRLEEAPAE